MQQVLYEGQFTINRVSVFTVYSAGPLAAGVMKMIKHYPVSYRRPRQNSGRRG